MVILGIRSKFPQSDILKIIKCSSCLMSLVTNRLESTLSYKNHPFMISLYSRELFHKNFCSSTIVNKSTISVQQWACAIHTIFISLISFKIDFRHDFLLVSALPSKKPSVTFSSPYQFFKNHLLCTLCYLFSFHISDIFILILEKLKSVQHKHLYY